MLLCSNNEFAETPKHNCLKKQRTLKQEIRIKWRKGKEKKVRSSSLLESWCSSRCTWRPVFVKKKALAIIKGKHIPNKFRYFKFFKIKKKERLDMNLGSWYQRSRRAWRPFSCEKVPTLGRREGGAERWRSCKGIVTVFSDMVVSKEEDFEFSWAMEPAGLEDKRWPLPFVSFQFACASRVRGVGQSKPRQSGYGVFPFYYFSSFCTNIKTVSLELSITSFRLKKLL